MGEFSTAVKNIQNRIQEALLASGRPSGSVRLIGVGKKQPFHKLLLAAKWGLQDFGENYVQEWQGKKEQISAENADLAKMIHWHFIGHLQSNKVKEVVGQVAYIHTIDSVKLAQKASEFAAKQAVVQKTLLEVNLAGEANKHGFDPAALMQNLPTLAKLPNLSWEGLMAIPPPLFPSEKMRPYFRKLKSLLDECNGLRVLESPMKELSMGMSQDFEIAIQEGATMIRIGTALFGPRE